MELGQYYHSNQTRIGNITDAEWKVALAKCKEHIKLKLKQKTLFGAHSAANLGTDPVDYYLELASEKILSGAWEWKQEFDLGEQMIRIVNSYTSKEVERTKTDKATTFKIIYGDIETEFYEIQAPESDGEEIQQYQDTINIIENAIRGDSELEFFWDAVKEGKKRSAIADLFEIKPKQLDKLKERFIRCIKTSQAAG